MQTQAFAMTYDLKPFRVIVRKNGLFKPFSFVWTRYARSFEACREAAWEACREEGCVVISIHEGAHRFELNGDWYQTDTETIELLRRLVEDAKKMNDGSAVAAVLAAGQKSGRISQETKS